MFLQGSMDRRRPAVSWKSDAVSLHDALEVCSLQSDLPGCPGDVPVVLFKGVQDEFFFDRVHGFPPDFFFQPLELFIGRWDAPGSLIDVLDHTQKRKFSGGYPVVFT